MRSVRQHALLYAMCLIALFPLTALAQDAVTVVSAQKKDALQTGTVHLSTMRKGGFST